MMFLLSDSKRMLASVDRMTAAGNEVRFSPKNLDCYVKHQGTGK